MRILQCLPMFDESFGGPVRAALAVAEAYEPRCEVLTVGIGTPGPEWKVAEGFRGRTVPFLPSHVGTFSLPMLEFARHAYLKFDLAHVHLNRGLGVLPMLEVLRRTGMPYIVQTHGMCDPWNGPKSAVDRLFTGPLLRGAERVLTLSEAESARLGRGHGRIRSQVMPNALTRPISPARHPRETGPFRVGFCARLHPRKGLDLFIETCAGLKAEGLNIIADVAGNDEGARPAAESRARALGLEVLWRGDLNYEAVDKFMADLDIMLHPAPREPFGMAMLEAFAKRVPLVAAASSGLAPVFQRYDAAVLAPDGDSSAWVRSVKALLADAPRRRQLTENGADLLSSEFSVGALGVRLTDVLAEVAA